MDLRWRALLALAALTAPIGCATSTPAPAHDQDDVDVAPPIASATAVVDREPMRVAPAASATGSVDEVEPARGEPRHRIPRDNDTDGDGIPDDTDLCPTIPESGRGDTRDGCPQPASNGPDRDGDGLSDAVDRCPDEFEDVDGFDDLDGCPDIDNDKDGIPDATDKCPSAPEPFNGLNDKDGCPD